ncbi:hypothetical protein [Carboxylicivirga sp. M1479]|uniref:hypothetical protein n=1 Tax=Carboxylicivirga sp. M1479 TaxID=2594476 RepID=UPI0011783A17|nr:hypothetical protein [Carboxylicivirga sp. M1479]TRX66331.1 hypothetical protein FNN09_14080 [Carboxylicivirga sp. M1479]
MYYRSKEVQQRFNIGVAIVFIINLSLMVFVNLLFGVLSTIITLGIFLTKAGLEIDTESGKMRRYYQFFNYISGTWRKIPALDYVTVVRVMMTCKKYQASSAKYVQAESSDYRFRVNLVTKEERPSVIKVMTTDKNNAIEEALALGESLGLGVVDATTRDRKWIKQSV